MEQIDPDTVTTDSSPRRAATVAELAQKIFASKARRRSWLAALPVEEKYRRFLQLQRMASQIKRAAGRPAPEPWPDGGLQEANSAKVPK
jgi:hypothetical protein